MAAFGGIKTYHLIHLDFKNRVYNVFEYERDRRLTASNAWKMIYHTEPVISEKLPAYATIMDYFGIIEKLGYDEKHCDRYATFNCF